MPNNQTASSAVVSASLEGSNDGAHIDTASDITHPRQRHAQHTEEHSVDEATALEKQKESEEQFLQRIDALWGPEPAYTETAEDRAGLFQQLYYGWIGDFIYKAARSSITEKDLPPPVRENRAYNCGRVLSRQVHADKHGARRWAPYVGCEVTLKGEPETHGWLRWVGCLQQSDLPRALLAGVEWTVAPRHRRVGRGKTTPALLHDGAVHGERLFHPRRQTTRPMCSCEPVEKIELLPRQSPVPPPPAPVSLDVLWSLVRAHRHHLLVQIPPKLLADVCALLIPVLLEFFVDYLGKDSPGWGTGLAIVAGVFLASVIQSCSSHKYDHMSIRAAAVFEISTLNVVFEKCLTVARKSLMLPELSIGRVMNIAGNDVDNIGDLNWYVMYFWSAPLQLGVCVVLLYRLVGWCALSSLAVLAVTLPIQAVLSKWQQEVREKMASIVDQRIRRTNELLSGIRIVKFMGWEPRFLSFIERARNVELAHLKRVQHSYVAFMFVDGATPIMVISIVFILYHAAGNVLTPRVVFPTIALLNTMRIPFFMLPIIVSAVLQCLVSSKRISVFLESDDTQAAAVGDIAELYTAGASAVYNDATVHTFLPVGLPRCRSRTTGMVARTLLWFKSRAVPEAEWCLLGDDGSLNEDPAAEVRANKQADALLQPSAASPTAAASSPEEVGRNSNNTKTEGGSDDNDGEDDAGISDQVHQLVTKDLLKDVNAIFPDGKLTLVVGATGSGKSTMLGSLLGELYLTSGELWASRSVAYVPQQSWIMNATLRNNILFFAEEDAARLKDAIDYCQLGPDLKMLASGLETEIGEKGINLSGGQKARVSLARAVYADRDMYLLDDPLSALDAHVGGKIFHGLLREKLAGKTRVLATHQLHLLPFADHIIVLRHGRVAFTGDYERYEAAHVSDALQEDGEQEAKAKSEAATAGANPETGVTAEVEDACGDGIAEAQADTTAAAAEEERGGSEAGDGPTGNADDGKLMTTEEKAIGSVPWLTYLAYMRACGGYAAWGVLAVVFSLTEVINVANGVWLSVWSVDAFHMEAATYLYWYLFIVFLGMFSSPIRSFLCYQHMRTGSKNLHHSLLLSVGIATMDFFDRTPVGRMLNRFTKDIGILDDTLNDSYLYLFQYLFSMLSTMTLMTVAQPLVIITLAPCGFIYFKLMKVYNASNRETRRIKSIAHSPVFTLLEESIHGQRTIAVYGKEHVTMREATGRLDTVYSALYMQNIANRWLGVRLEFVSCIIITCVAFFGVLGKQLQLSTQSIGLVSLSLTNALTLTETLNWLVRQVATVEANMNCVERILHYINGVEHEEMPEIPKLVDDMVCATAGCDNGINPEKADQVTVETFGSPTTPAAPHVVRAGSLEFRDVQMRYREGLPLVLRDVSFAIAPREKVGIVGRTGSGKSTLLLTFMRMVDVCGGEIVVSGRAIRAYGLRELRRQFSMIPQDPVLFDGTVRLNVDPFLEASSAEVWQALELVGLRERVASEPEGIDGRVLEGGANFSVGQRQLLCMARALLKKGSGFILMDEATANVDQSLDRHIQTTVMRAFSAYTVITIAHRLQTVACYDKIIVMDHGVVAEMGSPRELVENKASVFRGMVDALGGNGASEFQTLMNESLGSDRE